MTLYFDDIETGSELPELQMGPITHSDLVKYSGASGDFNPIHTVPEIAVQVGLDGIIAHGMLIMGYAGRMLSDWAGDGAVRQFKVRFSGMTKPGEVIVCRGKVNEKVEENGECLVKGKFTVKGAADESLKLKGDFAVALPKRT
jgi:acyl dehydratase